jgi:hypothetical protein|nr:MAG TPA: hypothetical protein [Caudoviricetes sp.]
MSDFVSDEMRLTVSTIAAGAIVFNALSGEEKP